MDELITLKKEINALSLEKQSLLRKEDRKEVTQGECDKMLKEIQNKINEHTKKIMSIFSNKQKASEAIEKKVEENKMADKPNEEKEEKKAGRVPKADSYTMLIVKALLRKDIKDMDALVARVDEQKPGRDKKRIEGQAKSIMYLVKNSDKPNTAKRWKNYTLDEKAFMLTENPQ